MRDRDVGEMCIDDLYNLIVAISQLLKLEVKVVQPGNELHFGRVASNDYELLGKEPFDDKTATVMLQSCLTKHLLKADILFGGEFEIIPVDSGICRCRASDPLFRGCHQAGSLSGVTRERHPASQSELLSGDNKIRGGKFFVKTLKSLRGRVFPGAILQPSGDEKKPAERTGTDVSGHRNRGISVDCILHHERQVFLFRSLFRYKPHETENGILNGLKHKTKHTRFTTV